MPASEMDGRGAPHLLSDIQKKLGLAVAFPKAPGTARVKLYPSVSRTELLAEEARLGRALSPLLQQLYTAVANGWDGLEFELLSVKRLSPKVDHTVATLYHRMRDARAKRGAVWAEHVVPFAHWGDLILSCVDLTDPSTADDPPVIRYEPNMPEAATHHYLQGAPFRGEGLIPESDRLSEWFEHWIDGVEMFKRPYSRQTRAT